MSSHRSGDPEDLRRWLADNLFRQLAFRTTQDVGQPTSAETFEATVAERQDALRSGRLAWSYVEIAVDEEVKVFDVLEVDDAWIAVGKLEETGVTINAERFPIVGVSLVRISDLAPYLAGL